MSGTIHKTPALAAFALGEPVLPIGFLPNGRPIFPIAGGAPDDPPADPPEGVSTEEWEALGDPGKRAIVRERARADEAERRAQAAAARPVPTPPKPDPNHGKPPEPVKPGETPDVAKLIADGIAAAIKPFEEREQQRVVAEKANLVRDAVVKAAGDRFFDPTDALANVDLTQMIDANGVADPAKITTALDATLATKPHLAKSTLRVAPPGIGAGGPPAGATEAEQVAAALAQMNTATGVRSPAAS